MAGLLASIYLGRELGRELAGSGQRFFFVESLIGAAVACGVQFAFAMLSTMFSANPDIKLAFALVLIIYSFPVYAVIIAGLAAIFRRRFKKKSSTS